MALRVRRVVTGHDADFHCSEGAQCHFVKTATDWVRGGAPDPSKPVLVLDTDDLDFPAALAQPEAFGPGGIQTVVMDPKSPQFAAEPLTTDRYSAILVASDETCGGCDLNTDTGTPDSDAINARKADSPWHDLRLRQAVNYAINREDVLRYAAKGNGVLVPALLPPGAVER